MTNLAITAALLALGAYAAAKKLRETPKTAAAEKARQKAG